MFSRSTLRSAAHLLLILTMTALAGCGSVNVTTDFYRGEKWKAVIEIALPAQALNLLGKTATQVDNQLNQRVRAARAQGARASWKKRQRQDLVVYTLNVKGKGLDTLSAVAFDGQADIRVQESNGRRAIYFGYDVNPGLGFESQTITLRGAKIIDGNGRWVNNRTMTWFQPNGLIEATLTERSSLGVAGVLGILALIAVVTGLAVGGVYWWQGRRRIPPAPCPVCDFWIPEGARFCPGCGTARE